MFFDELGENEKFVIQNYFFHSFDTLNQKLKFNKKSLYAFLGENMIFKRGLGRKIIFRQNIQGGQNF